MSINQNPIYIDYESIDLNEPVLHELGMRVFNTLRLSADKAVAHLAQPGAFPLPTAPDAVERRFLTLLRTLSPEQQQRAVANVMPQVNASEETRRARFGDLGQVDLHTATAITTQVAAIPLRLTVMLPAIHSPHPDLLGSAELYPANGAALVEEVGLRTERAPLPEADAPPEQLSFRIHSVTCVDETDPEGWGGSDDMFLAGIALTGIDRTLDTQPVGTIDLGSFDDGTVVTFSPPHQFATFDLRGSQWPRFYSVTMILIEKDQGDLSPVVSVLYEMAKEQAKKAVEEAVTKGLVMYIGPFAIAAGKIAAWVVNEFLNYLRSSWQHDLFNPLTSVITVPSAAARFPQGAFASRRLSQGITGHMGEYHIEYSWERSAPLNQWTAWHPFLSTSLQGRPAVYSRDPYVMDVFVRGTDNRLWQQHWNRGQWFDWARYDDLELSSSPVADSRDPEHIHIFARGNDGQLWFKEWRPAAGMSAWQPLGGQILGEPAVRSRNPHITDVFVRGTDNRLWQRLWYFDHWKDWVRHDDGFELASSPVVDSKDPEHIHIFAQGTDGQLWFKEWRPAHGMTAWQPLGGQILGEPAVRSRNPHITDVFVRGTDNRLWQKLWYFDHWEDWVLHGDAVGLTSSPAVNSMGPEHIQVFACGPHGQIWFKQWGGAGQIETLY